MASSNAKYVRFKLVLYTTIIGSFRFRDLRFLRAGSTFPIILKDLDDTYV